MVPQPFVISAASSAIWIACRRRSDSEVDVHYLLFYEAATHYEERRKPFRSAHLQHAQTAVARGELVLGGAFAHPIDGAVLLFRAESPAVAEDFAKNDPYVVNGLVKRWYVREWTTVVGTDAESRI
jgi:uncharacterized protein